MACGSGAAQSEEWGPRAASVGPLPSSERPARGPLGRRSRCARAQRVNKNGLHGSQLSLQLLLLLFLSLILLFLSFFSCSSCCYYRQNYHYSLHHHELGWSPAWRCRCWTWARLLWRRTRRPLRHLLSTPVRSRLSTQERIISSSLPKYAPYRKERHGVPAFQFVW